MGEYLEQRAEYDKEIERRVEVIKRLGSTAYESIEIEEHIILGEN